MRYVKKPDGGMSGDSTVSLDDKNETAAEQNQGDVREGEQRSSVSDTPDTADLYRLGSKHFEAGDWTGALDAYSAAVAKDHGKPQLYFRLGIVYGKLNEWSAAEQAYQAAFALDPTKGEYIFALAEALRKQQKVTEARDAYFSALPVLSIQAKSGVTSALFRWSWSLLECQYLDEALEVAIEAARAEGPCLKIGFLLRRICKGLGDKGDIYTALEGLDSLRSADGFDEMVLSNYVWLCWMYAVFEDNALAAAREVLFGAYGDPSAKEAALNLLLVFHGPSLELAEGGLRAIADSSAPYPNLVLSVATMLFSLNEEHRLLDLYSRFPQLREYCGESPAIAHAFLKLMQSEDFPETRALALETMAAFESVNRAQDEIWERISDSSLSVAIVGNSGREIGGKRGKEIDSHDLVIRFNDFSISPPYDVDYGQKVDIIIRVGRDLPIFDTYCESRDVILRTVRFLDTCKSWGLIRRLISRGCRVATFPTQFQEQLLHILRRDPSAGLTVTLAAAKLRQDITNVSHYGFSFLDQTGRNPTSAHYFDQSAPAGRHKWEGEAELFQKITGVTLSPLSQSESVETYEGIKRIRLEDYHSGYHCGCRAVIEYLKTAIAPLGVLTEDKNYDILIVNGEGSMHHDSINFNKKMEVLCEAIGRGKKVYLVNTVWQSNPNKYDHILKHLDGIVVREQSSYEDLLKNHGVESLIRLDVSYWAEVDEKAPFQDLEEKVAVGDFYSQEFETFVRLTGGSLVKHPFIDMGATDWSSLVRTLRTASLLVTGRHHGVFAACRARTPFVALRGNTHKIEGMVRMSGLPLPVCSSPLELPGKIAWARANRSLYEEFFHWMDEQPRFRLEDLP